MGGPRLSAFHILQALCVLLTLLEDGPQNTRASACPRRCPPDSSCVNGTSCRCNPGFKSSSGEIDISYRNRCEDIDECEVRRAVKACGRDADCHNTVGSYYCTCIPGYSLASGATKFSNASENTCQDVNECTSGRKPCHKTTHCLNNVGSYKCRCRPGWKPIPGSPNGPNNTVCEDVNECTSGEHSCHKSTQCNNTKGSYECLCRPGWKLVPGSPSGPHNTVCEEIFPTWNPPPGIKSQSLSNFFEKVQELSRDFKTASAQDTIHKFITSLDELELSGDLEALALSDRHRMATHLLSYLEEVLRNLAKTLPAPSFTYHSPLDTELSLMIQEQRNGTVTLGQSHARMKLNWTQAAGVGDSGPPVAGIFSSRKMETLLVNASVVLDPERKAQLEETYESSVNDAQSKLLSTVNTVFLSNKNTEKLDPPVTFSFSYHPETPKSRQELICAFWKGSNSGGYWSTTGCKKLGSSNNSITCQCNHLSSFAVLMAHYDVEDPKLALITKVGLALSLVCLLLCILTFLLVRPIQGSRTTVHLHLCICLFLGSAIFLAGIENEGGEGEGLSKRWLYLIGYGVPFLIVAISAAARPEGYGRRIYCWLDPARGFLWSFVGPVTFIILCNAVIFVITVWKLTKKFSEINPDMKKLKKARVLTITAIAQLLVLGCTWVFGLFLFDPRSQVLAYAFTILNCLQGFFLFLLHCLLNKKVREEYQKWACMVTGNKYSDFGTSTSSSSHNQTRVLRPSESGM
ncbi:CD97 antigen isoform X2 [Myotis lucifugus]|uniref:CD97 antigen isoform X2 n=1 Tax=Myotis lucifugus TaxID=59463 RepID=UPI000CCBE36D|nr:CD97 antigen isoform X2 [Myotis lucifugus]